MTGYFCWVPLREAHTPGPEYELAEAEGWLIDPVSHGFPPHQPWVIAECYPFDDEERIPCPFERVPARLECLLRSAKRYYPAIALALSFFECHPSQTPDDRELYAERLANEIERHLMAQQEAPYFLARATKHCLSGYRFAGEYVWVVGYDPYRRLVFWVTDDYYVYDSPISHFDVDEARLRLLPNPRPAGESGAVS